MFTNTGLLFAITLLLIVVAGELAFLDFTINELFLDMKRKSSEEKK